MRVEYQILAAVLLDLLLGDPRWLPHPVRAIGWLAVRVEIVCRKVLGSTRIAGLAAALAVYAAAGLAAWGAIRLAALVHPLAGDLVAIVVIYTTIAARDLARHSMAVLEVLADRSRGPSMGATAGLSSSAENTGGQATRGTLQSTNETTLAEARRRVAAMVGRDTAQLDAAGVVRAAVESVAESTVDGVTAPLFFAALGGPVGAMVYRAVNTLDSMFGHQDERYGRFGWAAARIDDAANYLPARLTAPLMCLAAFLLRRRPVQAVRILRRDGRKHASPNSGLTEAAMAGALGVQLGGVNYYDGQPLEKPTLGDALVPLSVRHIPLANALMLVTAGCFLVVTLVARAATIHCWHLWRAAG
jgi:adenosylcobinamide-phosphate synthase